MPWITLGESATGTSHALQQKPCQDAFRILTFGAADEWLVVAVSDGAGSASLSEIGATFVCDEFVHRIATMSATQSLDVRFVEELFHDVREGLFKQAEERGVAARELACTALVAIIGPTSTVFAQLGDGAIIYRVSEELRVAFWPEPIEYANATDFLTDADFTARLQVQVISASLDDVALLTDGLQRLALDYSSKCAYPGFFEPLFRDLRQAEAVDGLRCSFREFLESDRVNKRTDDDKTLVLGVRR